MQPFSKLEIQKSGKARLGNFVIVRTIASNGTLIMLQSIALVKNG